MNNKRYQRGYSLVEIAIVMVASLMMASWLAVSYYQVQKNERRQETMQTIEIIKEAIVDYAAKHSTPSYLVNNDATTVQYLWRTPAGRPYLPCPDITGDGIEDRRPIDDTAVITVNISRSDLETRGGYCYSNKGVVPWRTLDVPSTDHWGNRYTYRIENNFSNAMLGFDEHTRADQGLYTRPLNTVAIRSTVAVNATRNRDTTGHTVVAAIWGAGVISEDAPSIVCLSAPCASNVTATIIAGEVADGSMILRTGGYKLSSGAFTRFSPGHIVNGLPVVIVSHGENGFGAVRGDDEGAPKCRAAPPGDDERQNAYRRQAISGCPAVIPSDASAKQYGFVSHPQVDRAAGNTVDDFDDIVGWMSTDELVSALRKRGALPAELLPPIGLEQ